VLARTPLERKPVKIMLRKLLRSACDITRSAWPPKIVGHPVHLSHVGRNKGCNQHQLQRILTAKPPRIEVAAAAADDFLGNLDHLARYGVLRLLPKTARVTHLIDM
jgi:hypothetical protein